MWKITQRKFVYLGQKQGRSTHPERNSAGVPPKEEEHGKEAVKSFIWASLVAQMVKNLPVMQETWIRSLSQEDPLEEGMASHASKAVLPGLYLPLVLYLISLFTSDLPCGFFTQCQTLCNRMDYSPPVFAVHGILQEWIAIPFSRRSSWPKDWTLFSCIVGRFFTIWATGKSFLQGRTLLYTLAHLFVRIDTSAEAWERFNNTYYGVATPPLLTLCVCNGGDFLDLRSNRFAHLISLF